MIPMLTTMRRTVAATLAVAGTYAYFLIFPQFAFLHALRAGGMPSGEVRVLMGVMAAGGIGASVAVGRFGGARANRRFMLVGAVLCAFSAWIFGSEQGGVVLHGLVALFSGIGLGFMTVALASSLRGLCGPSLLAPACGAGTGIAYAVANLPPVFNARPEAQSLMSAGIALLVPLALLIAERPRHEPEMKPGLTPAGYRWGVALFLFLIWLDSACFAVIQETEALKSASWGPDADLICNGLVHAFAALAAGVFFRVRHLYGWLSVALALLVAASLMLGAGGPTAAHAHPLYAAGVSVYSTLLVAWLPLAHGAYCTPRVAALYAVAGWIGSALGVGMALDLHRIPVAFLAVAALAFAVAGVTKARLLVGGEGARA